MPNSKRVTSKKPQTESDALKGWQHIAAFLGLPISAAQRWAKSGMPVTREGRSVQASPEELNAEPVQIATESTDLSSELKRGSPMFGSKGRRKIRRKLRRFTEQSRKRLSTIAS